MLSQKAEVMAISIFAYHEEIELKKIREDEFDLCREVGIEEGIEKGIIALINICREVGLSREETMVKVAEKISLSPQKSEEYMDQFWK